MLDFGWGELVVIGIAALIFIGPKELPGVLRTLGHWMAKIRRMATEFQNQFQDAMREAELSELRKEVDEMATQAASYSNFDPLGTVRKEFETAGRDVEQSVTGAPGAETPSPPASSPAAAETSSAPGSAAERSVSPDAGDAPHTTGSAHAPTTETPQPKAGEGKSA